VRSILLATDGSPSAAAATRVALELASDLHARLVVASAEELPLPVYDMYSGADVAKRMRDPEGERVDDVLRRVQEEASARGIECTTAHLIGPVAEGICGEARLSEVGMIVVGAHGWGAFGRLVHGSVSTELVHRAPCPVLVVRGGDEARRPIGAREGTVER
jgi:nucleotide-binding universal stress UspA family protein